MKLTALTTLLLLLLVPGCSTPGSANARPLNQTEVDVSWAFTRLRNGVAVGAVTLAERQQVECAYAGYQAA